MKQINKAWDETMAKARKDADKLVKLLKCLDLDLPDDLDYPETNAQVEAVGDFADSFYDLACTLIGHSEALMVSGDCQINLEEDLLNRDGPGEFQGYPFGG